MIMQKLILPVNDAIISASFLNYNYEKKFGFKHYGVDMYGSQQVWSCGDGVVVSKGFDPLYGNFVSILYTDCIKRNTPGKTNVVANFFHLKNIQVTASIVNKDTPLGAMGETGKYANGVHLHLEMWEFKYTPYLLSGFNSLNFRAKPMELLNPLAWLYVKKDAPDFQAISFENSIYVDKGDANVNYNL